jgi:putative Holliday junction resolvase
VTSSYVGERVIGIDPGSRRFGVAIGVSGVASPLAVIQREKTLELTVERLATLIIEEEVTAVVIGLPLHLDGSEGSSSKAARKFARALANFVSVPVMLHDERLTTVTADRAMLDAGLRAEERRRHVDKIAAAIMLQSWLDAGATGDAI